jgi:hypothetical protein
MYGEPRRQKPAGDGMHNKPGQPREEINMAIVWEQYYKTQVAEVK